MQNGSDKPIFDQKRKMWSDALTNFAGKQIPLWIMNSNDVYKVSNKTIANQRVP